MTPVREAPGRGPTPSHIAVVVRDGGDITGLSWPRAYLGKGVVKRMPYAFFESRARLRKWAVSQQSVRVPHSGRPIIM